MQDCWIRNTVGVRGGLEESLVWSMILQPIQIRSMWGETCCSVTDGKLQLKHVPAAKKSDMNKNKKH